MSAPTEYSASGRVEGSQLNTYRRIMLLIRNPRDAFALFSAEEKLRDAKLIYVLYIAVRFPVIAQRVLVKGDTVSLLQDNPALLFMAGLAFGVFFAVAGLCFIGLIFHIIFNVILKAGRTFKDMLVVIALSMAPQILLVSEFPSLIMNFGSSDTYVAFLFLRLVVDVFVLRTLFFGVKSLFQKNSAHH